MCVWVDGDKRKKDNKRYLSVTEDQADWISSTKAKSSSQLTGRWKTARPGSAHDRNTQVFTTVAPDSNPFEEDDVDRLYEQEDDHEFQLTEALLLDVQNLKKRFPESLTKQFGPHVAPYSSKQQTMIRPKVQGSAEAAQQALEQGC